MEQFRPLTSSRAVSPHEESQAELQQALDLTLVHSRKVYITGYLYKLEDRDLNGHSIPGPIWKRVFARLAGIILSIWDAEGSGGAAEGGGKAPLTVMSVAESQVRVLDAGQANSLAGRPGQILAINTEGPKSMLFSFSGPDSPLSWAAAFRLATWEKARIEEIYTGHLLRTKMSTSPQLGQPESTLHRGRLEGWAEFRLGGRLQWERLWVVISKSAASLHAEGSGSSLSKLAGFIGGNRSASSFEDNYGGSSIGGPVIAFYPSNKAKDRKRLRYKAVMATQAFALCPERLKSTEHSSLFKLEAMFKDEDQRSSMYQEDYALLSVEADGAGQASSEMIKWLIAIHDVFRLYGRPEGYIWDPRNSKSMFFAYPWGAHRENLFLGCNAAEALDWRTYETSSIRAALRDILTLRLAEGPSDISQSQGQVLHTDGSFAYETNRLPSWDPVISPSQPRRQPSTVLPGASIWPRPHSIYELAEFAKDSSLSSARGIKDWLRIADALRKEGQRSVQEGDIQGGFLYLARSATYILEKIPYHAAYYDLNPTQMSNLKNNGDEILHQLEQLKPRLTDAYELWRAEDPRNASSPSKLQMAYGAKLAQLSAPKARGTSGREHLISPDQGRKQSSLELSRPSMRLRPHPIYELAEFAKDSSLPSAMGIKDWLRIADALRKEGQRSVQEGDTQGGYLYLARSATYILEKIPYHAAYHDLNPTQMSNLKNNGHEILHALEQLKPRLTDAYELWRAEEPRNATAVSELQTAYGAELAQLSTPKPTKGSGGRIEASPEDYATTSQPISMAPMRPSVLASDISREFYNLRLNTEPQDTSHSVGNPIIARDVDERRWDEQSAGWEKGRSWGMEERQGLWEGQRLAPVAKGATSNVFEGGEAILPTEEDRAISDQDHVAFSKRREDVVPALEDLMVEHKPSDLTDQVSIPDYRNPAQGGLADVYAGLWNDRRVAVKVLRFRKSQQMDAYWEASHLRRITREMNVWAALKHPNICEFLGYATNFSDYPAMISTWCQRGTASEHLKRQSLSIMERMRLTQDVIDGIHYLHELKVIHGDLKPSNILVDDHCVAQLCDFGLVRLAEWEGPAGMTTTTPYTGTERYKAPELFETAENRHPVATFEGDIFSLGCIMLQFVEQVDPFRRFSTPREVKNAVMDGESPALRSETTHALSESTEFFWNLLEACWGDESDRPAIGIVINAMNYFAQRIPESQ